MTIDCDGCATSGLSSKESKSPVWSAGLRFGLAWFRLSGRGPLTTLRGDGLSHLADQERLEIWLVAGPFQADIRVPRLATDEIALSVGAGYFELAGLALQGFGNVVGGYAVIQLHGTSSLSFFGLSHPRVEQVLG